SASQGPGSNMGASQGSPTPPGEEEQETATIPITSQDLHQMRGHRLRTAVPPPAPPADGEQLF
ncbi:MAG: hypothetical protein ACYCS2_05220, partial [Acidimicrobiales bacterium]